jgi:hypothetical protein
LFLLRKKFVNDSEHAIVAVFDINSYVLSLRYYDACVAHGVADADVVAINRRLTVCIVTYNEVGSACYGME